MTNHIDMLICHTAICAGASQISPDGRTEIAYANFRSPRRKKTLRNGEKMIAFVKGTLEAVYEDRIIVENQGIGFEILVSGNVLHAVPGIGQKIKVFTYLHVKEDLFQLYGFLTGEELNMFKLLITVNGIGPKGALGILTAMDVDTLRFAILAEDTKTIAGAPGIGKKTAGKLVLELKDKCSLEDTLEHSLAKAPASETAPAVSGVKKDAVEALTALGYSAAEAAAAVGKTELTPDMTVEEVLKQSLRNL